MPMPVPPDLRDFAWGYYYHLCRRDDRTLTTWAKAIRTMAVSRDGRFIALMGNDVVQLLDAHTGKVLQSIPVRYFCDALAFDPESKILAFPGDLGKDQDGTTWRTVQVWDVAAGKGLPALLKGHAERITSLAFSPDGRTLAVGSMSFDQKEQRAYGGIKLWNTGDWKEKAALQGRVGQVTCLAFSPDGGTLACGNLSVGSPGEPTLHLWDTRTGGKRSVSLAQDNNPSSVSFSPDSRSLALGGNQAVKLLDVASLQFLGTLGGHPREVEALSFRADGKVLAAASGDLVKLWDMAARKPLAWLRPRGPFPDSAGFVRGAAFNPEGNLITATRFADAVYGKFQSTEVQLWDTRPGPTVAFRCLDAGKPISRSSMSFSPDGKTLATVIGPDLVLWRIATGRKGPTFPGSKDWRQLAQLNADGQTLVDVVWPIGEGGVVNSWDVATQKPRGSQPLHLRGDSGTLALTRDGRTLAASREVVIARGPTDIQLVDVLSGDEVRTLAAGHGPLGVTALAFREDGRILASGGADGSVILWNAASGSKQATMERHATPVYSLALSPDGKEVASGSYDGTIKFWDANSGKELATSRGHTNLVASLAFSPDGKTLASASWDNTIILWEPTTGQRARHLDRT